MGKSTVSAMFRELGVPVFDADGAVHELYAPNGAAVAPVEAAFPGVVRKHGPGQGGIDREALSKHVVGVPEAIRRLEAIVHPLVGEMRRSFLERARAEGKPLVVLDIPLLFEGSGQSQCDVTAVVSAPMEAQRERVLARPGMTPQKFEAILAKQVPDAKKRLLADYIIPTGGSIELTRKHVKQLVESLTANGALGGDDERT